MQHRSLLLVMGPSVWNVPHPTAPGVPGHQASPEASPEGGPGRTPPRSPRGSTAWRHLLPGPEGRQYRARQQESPCRRSRRPARSPPRSRSSGRPASSPKSTTPTSRSPRSRAPSRGTATTTRTSSSSSSRGTCASRWKGPTVELGEGELFVVPKGVRHNPVAEDECHLLLIERKSTLHTGTHGHRQDAVDRGTAPSRVGTRHGDRRVNGGWRALPAART